MSGVPSGLLGRIAVLTIVVVFFQIGVVSEVPVFGVSADLSTLLVAFVGLLCGSTVGAATGFAVGLLVDLALVQTLGVTSLTLTVVGYWAGRLREVRDPHLSESSLTQHRPQFVPLEGTAQRVGHIGNSKQKPKNAAQQRNKRRCRQRHL